MLLNCGAGKTLESPLNSKGIKPVNLKEINPENPLKDWCWSWNSNTLAIWREESTHWKRPWCWERLRAGEGDDRGWNVWIASLTQWTWVWVNSGKWWWTGRPGMLDSIGPQRVRCHWVTELNWTDRLYRYKTLIFKNILFHKEFQKKDEMLVEALSNGEHWANRKIIKIWKGLTDG